MLSLRVSHIESVADVASEEGSTRTIMVSVIGYLPGASDKGKSKKAPPPCVDHG